MNQNYYALNKMFIFTPKLILEKKLVKKISNYHEHTLNTKLKKLLICKFRNINKIPSNITYDLFIIKNFTELATKCKDKTNFTF